MQDHLAVGVSLEFCAYWECFLESLVVVDFAIDTEDLLFIFGNERLSTGIYKVGRIESVSVIS